MPHKNIPLPPSLSEKWGHLQFIQYKGNDEWSSECPKCGSFGHVGNDWPDRFFMSDADSTGNARGQCRRCQHFEWADQDVDDPPDPARILEQQEHRIKMQKQEALRLRAKISSLQNSAYWRGWHDGMTAVQRQLWLDAGIPESFQDRWELGYTAEYRGTAAGSPFSSPALTIPYFYPGREAYNVQYRLLNPPKEKDKYRFAKGLTPGLWLADPDDVPSGPCLLCEGVKKAAVAYVKIVAELDYTGLTIASAPNKSPNLNSLDLIGDCDPIYILFDPDAYEPTRTKKGERKPPAIAGVFKYLRGLKHDVRLIKLPMKLDDMLLLDGITGNTVLNAMRRARIDL